MKNNLWHFSFVAFLLMAFNLPIRSQTISGVYSGNGLPMSQEEKAWRKCKGFNDCYRLGPGDVLTVNVLQSTDSKHDVRIGADGMLPLPLAGGVTASCRTVDELIKEATQKLEEFFVEPKLEITIKEYRPDALIHVSGAVSYPKLLLPLSRVRLYDVIAVSGGFTERAVGHIKLTRPEKLPLTCPDLSSLEKSQDKSGTFTYSILELFSGKEGTNPEILAGDIVEVEEQEIVYVDGLVNVIRSVAFSDGLNLKQALEKAGGFLENKRNLYIVVISPCTPNSVIKRTTLKTLDDKSLKAVQLKANDYIFVGSESAFHMLHAVGCFKRSEISLTVRIIR